MWPKVKTAIVVLILSCLIWVFAERKVVQKATVDVPVKIEQSSGDILVQYLDEDGNTEADNSKIVKLTVEGPAGRVQAVGEKYLSVIPLDMSKLALDLKEGESKSDWVGVATLLNDRLPAIEGDNFLQVTEADPKTLYVKVTRLERKPVPVKVVWNRQELLQAVVTPAEVEPYVVEGMVIVARVNLTDEQYRQAKEKKISVTATYLLPNRTAEEFKVEVKLPEGIEQKPEKIKDPRLGILMPLHMQDEYYVDIDADVAKLDDYNPIECLGSPGAVSKYRESDIHLRLEIFEDDIKDLSVFRDRLLEYHLLDDYGQIKIINRDSRKPIKFQLKKRQAATVTKKEN